MATGQNIHTYFEGTWHKGNLAIINAADHGAWLGSNVFDGADQWGEILTLLPVLVVLELVLSADNAVALAAIARSGQRPKQERLALNIGIGLALVLRLGLIVVAQWVLQNAWVQLLAALYLLWLFVDHLRSQQDAADLETSVGKSVILEVTIGNI